MIIKRISISNFQIHKKLDVHLAEFTAILGKSSSGKSSILRALQFLFYGDWDATYPNDPELETSIAIQLEDGTIWARFRNGRKNYALCRKPGQKSIAYKDFGEFIPGLLDEINVRPIKIGASSINLNFSSQDDLPFLIHESKPAKAQWIGRLYGAHIINNMMRLASKDKRSLESDKNTAEEEAYKLSSELDKYGDVESQAASLARVGELLERLQALSDCQSTIGTIMLDHEALKAGRRVLEADTDGLRSGLVRLVDLVAAQDERLKLCREEWALNQRAHVLNADTGGMRLDLVLLADIRDKLAEYHTLTRELAETGGLFDACSRKLIDCGPELERLRKELTKSAFTGGKCPLCLGKPRKIDHEAIANNLKELVGSIE